MIALHKQRATLLSLSCCHPPPPPSPETLVFSPPMAASPSPFPLKFIFLNFQCIFCLPFFSLIFCCLGPCGVLMDAVVKSWKWE